MIQSLMTIISFDSLTDLWQTRSFKVSKALWNPLALSHGGTGLCGSIRAVCCASESPDAVLILDEEFVPA